MKKFLRKPIHPPSWLGCLVILNLHFIFFSFLFFFFSFFSFSPSFPFLSSTKLFCFFVLIQQEETSSHFPICHMSFICSICHISHGHMHEIANTTPHGSYVMCPSLSLPCGIHIVIHVAPLHVSSDTHASKYVKF